MSNEVSVKIPVSIIRNKDLSPIDKLVYGRIYSFMPDTCFMRTADFAKELNLARATVVSSIKYLSCLMLIKETEYGYVCIEE